MPGRGPSAKEPEKSLMSGAETRLRFAHTVIAAKLRENTSPLFPWEQGGKNSEKMHPASGMAPGIGARQASGALSPGEAKTVTLARFLLERALRKTEMPPGDNRAASTRLRRPSRVPKSGFPQCSGKTQTFFKKGVDPIATIDTKV